MRVAFDVTPLISGGTGVARYVRELTAALPTPEVQLRRFAIGRSCTGALPADVSHLGVPLRLVHRSWALLGWPPAERLASPCDVVHSPDLVPPPTSRPLVVTVHDLDAVEQPHLHPPRAVALQRLQLDCARRRATAVLAVSEATASALRRHGVSPETILVAPHGVPALPAPDLSAAPPPPFLLAVGAVCLRKGLDTLIAAFARARLGDVRLVLAGPDGWGSERVAAAIRDHRVADRVQRLGHVSEAQLAGLYVRCLAVVVPSLAEGFGLAALEALAAGAPVVASDIPALREVAGDAAVYAAAGEPEAWAAALERLVGDEALRSDLAARGPAVAAPFTWNRTAAITVEAYRRARDAA